MSNRKHTEKSPSKMITKKDSSKSNQHTKNKKVCIKMLDYLAF
ncbi:MAG: hypothetical protein Q8936_09315 [Bacillota bacterium]|nr:hypothetical protein [Bacillota bacterium]